MKIAMMQPTFMPWQGFFELIYKSDIFIILDDFQFSVQSYHQRNRLFVNKGQVDWYTVPVQKSISFGEPLKKVRINDNIPWREKTWKRIQQNYSKTSFYPEFAPIVQKWLFDQTESLAALNINFIRLVCDALDFRRDFIFSSQFPSSSQRSVRVAELLRSNQADTYYCARGSFEYMLADGMFPLSDVIVLFQDFQPKVYSQLGSPQTFVAYLSVLDALMNIGPKQTRDLIIQGTEKWLTWDEVTNNKNKLQQEEMQ